MEDYTLTIPENNSKALALLNYIKTLDFVKLTKTTDWYDELTEKQKESIDRGLKQSGEGKLITNENARKRIDSFFKQHG